ENGTRIQPVSGLVAVRRQDMVQAGVFQVVRRMPLSWAGLLVAKACHRLDETTLRGGHATGLPIERYELLARAIDGNFENTANSRGIELGFDVTWEEV